MTLDERAVKDSLSHGLGRDKAAAFAAVPEVLKQGRVVQREPMRGKQATGNVFYIAAPIRLGDKDMIEVVLVKSGQNTRRM